ncbi:MAG: transcriptional repressor, partial [Ignavibacteria bacterium]|nr:transcriptional repressor [Ignavibacteria bacterium]
KNEIKSLSIGNVYRNIRILIEQGLIINRDFGDGIEHFDAMTQIHYHFICEKRADFSALLTIFYSFFI